MITTPKLDAKSRVACMTVVAQSFDASKAAFLQWLEQEATDPELLAIGMTAGAELESGCLDRCDARTKRVATAAHQRFQTWHQARLAARSKEQR